MSYQLIECDFDTTIKRIETGGHVFEFEYPYHLRLVDYEQLKYIHNPDEVVIKETEINFLITYPVKPEKWVLLKSNDSKGFTRVELIEKIMNEYHILYEEEENSEYEIWGHELGDLDIEGIKFYPEDLTLHLFVGS